MPNITDILKFKGTWRIYQQKLLEELGLHFSDRKLHVVAAPGAGKTTLGIEVIRRLGNPTLILSPTVVIKNQWKYRILDDFCQPDFNPDEISTDLENVKDITIGTYQRLQAIYKKGWKDEFIRQLKERGIKTIVLDEAHHLRTEWYRTLDKLINELSENKPEFRVVSLTATPPYDVEEREWKNYYNLCGEIDAEISIPELVKHKDLCPHQDLVYFSNLNDDEKKIVYDFTENRKGFFKYLEKNSDLLYSIETSDFMNNLEENFDIIYADTEFTISLISYLFSIDNTHIKATELLNFLELKREQIPEFNYEIAEDLFNGILGKFKKYFKNHLKLKAKLKEFKLLKNASRVDFMGETNFKKLFARSQNKLNSIEAITAAEYNILGNELREVILLDYIGSDSGVHGLNIISAFKILNNQRPKNLKIAVLTGSIVIIPKVAKEMLDKVREEKGIPQTKILYADYNEEYLRVENYGEVDLVSLMTEVFSQGGVNVLIGTHALLGEGWDSPCINTLLIGSVVGSFMLSNQIRGRALRVDKKNPDKTANIWHLLAVESKFERGYDYRTIQRRFETFDGISYVSDTIENGFERLGYDFANYHPEKKDVLNEQSIERAINRQKLPAKWIKCLTLKKSLLPRKQKAGMYQGIKISEVNNTNYFIYKGQELPVTPGREFFNFLINYGPAGIFFITIICGLFSTFFSNTVIPILASIIIVFFTVLFISLTPAKYIRITAINSYLYKPNALAIGLIMTLVPQNYLTPQTRYKNWTPSVAEYPITYDSYKKVLLFERCDGYAGIWDETSKKLFMQTYQELFEQKENTKFVIKFKNFKDKYIFAPTYFQTQKEVDTFAYEVSRFFGPVEVISLGENIGKRELLKARYNQFIQAQADKKRIWNAGR